MTHSRIQLGKTGEEYAVSFLQKQHYKVIARNTRTPFGEIDIIARDGRTTCFIEVKTRRSDAYGLPAEAISKTKQRKIIKAALWYMTRHRLNEQLVRFDAVSVMCGQGNEMAADLIKDAFTVSHF